MGSCCMRNLSQVRQPAPAQSTASKDYKKIPTNIKIIPASPDQLSIRQDSVSESMSDPPESPPKDPLVSPPKHRNLIEIAKSQITASQTLKSETDKIKTKQLFTLASLKIPGSEMSESESDNSSVQSEDIKVEKHVRKMSHDLVHSNFTLSENRQKMRPYLKIEKKLKNSEGKTVINQYTFLDLLGQGAFGKVFKAIDDNGEYFAIKVYNKRILKNRWIGKKRTAWEAVHDEIEVMEKLDHKGCVGLVEVIDEATSKKIYIVMEFVDGGSLAEKCPLDINSSRIIFKQLAETIQYLHNEAMVVHRDIKPQNLLVSSSLTLKVCDFGGSQFLHNQKDEMSNSAGTFAFMPPEAHKNGVYKGRPADIWACGITLYFMLTGQSPYHNKSFSRLMEEIDQACIDLPQIFDEEVRDLIKKMTDKDSFRRIDIDSVIKHSWLSQS